MGHKPFHVPLKSVFRFRIISICSFTSSRHDGNDDDDYNDYNDDDDDDCDGRRMTAATHSIALLLAGVDSPPSVDA